MDDKKKLTSSSPIKKCQVFNLAYKEDKRERSIIPFVDLKIIKLHASRENLTKLSLKKKIFLMSANSILRIRQRYSINQNRFMISVFRIFLLINLVYMQRNKPIIIPSENNKQLHERLHKRFSLRFQKQKSSSFSSISSIFGTRFEITRVTHSSKMMV